MITGHESGLDISDQIGKIHIYVNFYQTDWNQVSD
jgi:hypothetical protein